MNHEIHVSPETIGVATVIIVLHIIGGFFSLALFYSIVLERATLITSKNGLAICLLCATSSVWGLGHSILAPIFLSAKTEFTKHVVCQLVGGNIFLFTGLTIGAHFLLCIDRFMMIVYQKEISALGFFAVFLGCFCVLGSAVIAILTSQSQFQPIESGSWCAPVFVSRGLAIIGPTIIMLYCVLILICMSCMYGKIYWEVRKVENEVEKLSVATHERKEAKLQRRLFYRCLLILGTFLFTFGFSFGLFAYRTVSGEHVSFWVEASATIMSSFDLSFTPLVIILTSFPHKKAFFRHLFRIELKRGTSGQNSTQSRLVTVTSTKASLTLTSSGAHHLF